MPSITTGNSRVIRALWAIYAILLYIIEGIDTLRCNFDHPHGLLSSNALAMCDIDIGYIGSTTVVCPRRVNDTDYAWHPRPASDERGKNNTYISENGEFRPIAISDIVHSETNNPLIWFKSNASQTELQFTKPTNDLFSITERRLIFICGPRDLVLNDTLQSHLDSLSGFGQMQALPWTSNTPLAHEMSKIGHGIGIFFLYSGSTHLPLQGCGSRPSTLFAPDNVVTVHPVTGVRSCVADPMSKSRIGFLCEGRLEPEDCMKSLLEKDGDVITAPRPYSYLNFSSHRPWVVARYFNDLALPPFNGECRCIDSKKGDVKARIEIRTKTDYICDIASKVFRDRYQPIRGPWCSVVIHPGSTLTIKFPIQVTSPASVNEPSDEHDEDLSAVPFSQLPSIYEYETEFLPKGSMKLRQLKTAYDFDVYNEVLYDEAIAGEALELDASQMSRGEVKLKYHSDKPLALKKGANLFVYHWTLKSRNSYVLDGIRAIVNVSFAFTHRYAIVGCDRGQRNVFHQETSKNYCSTKWMGNGIGSIYECLYHNMRNAKQSGIYCRPGEELFPRNCDSTGYDLYSNKVLPFPESVRNVTSYPIPGFQIFDMSIQKAAVSYACFCVDQRGYEKSKLILEYNHHEYHTYPVSQETASYTLLPHLLLPWGDAGLLIEGLASPTNVVLQNVLRGSITARVGTTLWLGCTPGPEVVPSEYVEHVADNGDIITTWLPNQPDLYYYTVNQMPNGPELIRKRYKDSLATTPGGLEFTYMELDTTPVSQIILIQLHRGAIIISKDRVHRKFVPMTFVCGKVPEQSDLSPTSYTPALPNLRLIGSSALYMWHMVQVNVETTDPYMQGCGVTYASDELFKPETPQLYDADGNPQVGCKIDLQAAKEAAFYCPAPYVLDPPNCFSQVFVDGEVKSMSDLSKSLVTSRSNHFVILRFDRSRAVLGETLRQTPPLECRCVTAKGIVLSTIQIENYYSKY
ncbi:hypothetical protein, conserved [Babesia ovata]|uniref:6-Cys domain-containing protein n=1 Tax=Babesia ovata TaxID=189622 RepID=A0A2H6KCP9_9APIC|nr:uncharacterized protein BOVATA_022640 [Babesia ovata]GBE60771.1 hypothetical protein, conserved [Babesia ovata]